MNTASRFDSHLMHLLDARILAFRVGGDDAEYFSSGYFDAIEFQVKSEESFLEEEQIVNILLRITANAISIPEDAPEERQEFPGLGEFTIGFTFFIENYHELVVGPTEEVAHAVVDGVLMAHLFAIAYSTARGMILVKTRGTALEGGILPIMDPRELMERGEG